MSERAQSNGQQPGPVSCADAAFERLMRDVQSLAEPSSPSPRRTAQLLEDALSGWGGPQGGAAQPRAAAARSLDLVSELMNDALGLLAGFVDSNLPGTEPSEGTTQVESITVSGRPGSSAGTTIWVHSQQPTHRPVPLRLTDLFAHDGSRLPASAGTFRVVATPASGPGSAAEPGSVSSWLEIEIPSDLSPGVYHGHVLAVGLPDSAINLRLLVQP